MTYQKRELCISTVFWSNEPIIFPGRDVFWAPQEETIEHQISYVGNEHQKKRQMSTKLIMCEKSTEK